MNWDVPTIRSLKLRFLPDQFIAGACFFYSVAQSMHAIGRDIPLSDTSLHAKPIGVYSEMCGFLVQESVLAVNKDLDRVAWGARPKAVYLSSLPVWQSM